MNIIIIIIIVIIIIIILKTRSSHNAMCGSRETNVKAEKAIISLFE